MAFLELLAKGVAAKVKEVPPYLGGRHPVAFGIQPSVTTRVAGNVLVLGMLRSVDLHDRTLLQADEVDDVGTHRMLTPQARAIELLEAQRVPELSLGIAHAFPQGTGALTGMAQCSVESVD